MLAALYVSPKGPFWQRQGIDAWDEKRDARLYTGEHPVLAFPPCARWCRLAPVVEKRYGYKRGEDGGCFESALANVRRCGGVLEHPAFTDAWVRFGLLPPRPGGGWSRTTLAPNDWVCEVAQVAYGHRARKLTWLLYVGENPPAELDWSRPMHSGVVSGMRNNCGRPLSERVWPAEASRTPEAFAQALIDLVTHSAMNRHA